MVRPTLFAFNIVPPPPWNDQGPVEESFNSRLSYGLLLNLVAGAFLKGPYVPIRANEILNSEAIST
jgi:hypothetical protein